MASNEDANFCRMQHLIDEMDRSNQRINLFNKKFEMEEHDQESTVKHLSPLGRQFDLLDDVCRSEESDGTSGHELPPSRFSKNLEDSGCDEVINSAIAEVSKDFLSGLQTSGTQNQCGDSDESRISSDTDFKLIGGMPSYARYPETAAGLSDTDWNPYGTESDNNQSPHSQSAQSLSKELKSNTTTPFLPILSSTGLNAITPNSDDKVFSVNSQSHLSDIREVSECSSLACQDLKPDISNGKMHLTRKADWAITPQRGRRHQPSSILNHLIKDQEQDKILPQEKIAGHSNRSPKESASSDEEKKMIASTSSTGYSSGTSGVKTNVDISKEKTTQDISKYQHMSVFERAKLMGIPEDILFDKPDKNKTHFINGRNSNEKISCGGLSDYDSDDPLAHRVQHILSETAYLSSGAEKANYSKPTVDYDLLKKDLQEIQDNLESLSSSSPADSKKQLDGSSLSSDKEDILSTASTPDKNRNSPVWDFAEVIGSLANSIQPSGSHIQKSVTKRVSLNSDGDETRSSDSSHKSEDHIAVSENVKSNYRDLHTSHDIDQMLSTFRDQRHQLESRYQQLSNQGLAEKVFRILTNQDPESHADGILSEVSAEEKEMKARMALKQHAKDFNFSSNSSLMEDSNRSLGLPDDIRKKLDLSSISSIDSSKVFDRSSFNFPTSSRGFSAFDDAKRFLSSQMVKASERTFNHSIDLTYPQSIQCYPLFTNKSVKEDGEKRKQEEDSKAQNAGTGEETASETHKKDASLSLQDKNKPDVSPQENLGKEKHESLSNTDAGSISKSKEKYRPYRPPGSKEVYYTESDTASVADSVTTMESTHIGSDDAAGPHLPLSAYGSRKDAPNVDGIYGTRKNLSTVQEGTEPSSVEDKSSQDGKENKPSQGQTEETSSRHVQPEIHSQQDSGNGRSGCTVTTDRYSNSIWAKREDQPNISLTAKWEEKSEQRVSVNTLSHREPVSSMQNVSAARRNARWANRMEEQNRDEMRGLDERNVERDRLFEHVTAQRPSRFTGMDVTDAARDGQDHASLRKDITLPTNAFVSQGQNSPEEREPMSLRIKLAYTNTNRTPERNLERDEQFSRLDNGVRSRLTDEYNFRTAERYRFKPGEHFMCHQNLVRSASDENLNSSQRDARLSPAFRRALSPELMTSIGSRSPILGRSIERSLARPPSDYPSKSSGTNHSTSPLDRRPYSLSDPPTFLARERSLSPRQYVTSPKNEPRSSQLRAYTRDLPPSSQEKLHLHETRSSNQQINSDRNQANERRQHYTDRYVTRQPSPTSFTRRQEMVERSHDAGGRYALRQASPGSVSKRKVELTLEGMSSESEADKEVDTEPMSKRAQLLKEALSHEKEPNINPDINEMWDQFKAYNESDDSSINTARMEAVADLLKSPSTHLVSQYLKEREEYRIERQERVEREREKRIKEQLKVHKSSSSEDDLNERYHELLMAKEEERAKRRSAKKKKGKNGEPVKVPNATRDQKKGEDKCTESLYSIPEDRSFEQSPGKLSAGSKARTQVSSQPNMIDPNMMKLRDKISNQRNKVNRDMMKEIIKIEKLKKLEDLLKAKRKGKITSQMLEQQLEELSSTSQTVSDNSQDNVRFMEQNSTVLSDDSTTAKDSSGEMRMWKMRKENRHKDLEMAGEDRDQLHSKNSSNNNKENKSKLKSACLPNDLQCQSEMKLLKLVKEGYLTADEAYTVALARTGRDESLLEEDVSRTLSENDSSFSTNRLHKLYSPYSRSSTLSAQVRHIPKLKYSDSVIDDSFNNGSYWLGNEKQTYKNHRQSNPESLSPQHSKFSMRQGTQKEDRGNNFMSSVSGNHKRERGRPRSQSPLNATRQRHAGQRKIFLSDHQSPVRAHSNSPSRLAKGTNNFPVRGKHGHCSRGRKYQSENDPAKMKRDFNRGVAWHIDMNSPPDQWKEPVPLQEIPLNRRSDKKHLLKISNVEKKHNSIHLKKPVAEQSIWQKSRHPNGIPKLQWEEVVSQDALASKTNHWEVDPIMDKVQYILNKPSTNLLSDQSSMISGKDADCAKSLSKLSLQEAFLKRKQDFISRCRERQKRLALSKEDRQMQECLRLEREAIFAEHERIGAANVYAHPYSDNLHQPKRRLLTKQEMKEMTARKYKNLPEVIEKKEEDRRKIEYKLNRLRANLFNKKVQKEILKKRYKQRG